MAGSMKGATKKSHVRRTKSENGGADSQKKPSLTLKLERELESYYEQYSE